MAHDLMSFRLPSGPASWATLILLGFLAVAAVFDLVQRRIPNLLILGGLITAFVIAMSSGLAGVGRMAAGALAALFVLIPVYGMGLMAAGDVKLISMTGGFLGLHHLLFALLGIFVAGGLLAVLYLYRPPSKQTTGLERSGIPYGVAVFGGVAGYVALYL